MSMFGVSGTSFLIAEFEEWLPAVIDRIMALARPAEIEHLRAKCRADKALCLVCPDGLVVIELRPAGQEMEMFILLGVAFEHGAFQRQEPALLSIARDLGAATIAFEARRRGWARRLGPEWRPRGSNQFVRSV